MGILNCTPDSFFPGSRTATGPEGLEAAREMINQGADILDIGGESTRPGSRFVSEEDEIRRVVPLIKEIRKESNIPISVDTRKAPVAKAALDAGADMINDVSALRDDPALGNLAAERKVPVILMHKRGTPEIMQVDPHYEDTIGEIKKELMQAVTRALQMGIQPAQIILDPGIGFGKRHIDNLLILKNLDILRETGYPILMGLSRKSFLGRILDNEVEDRLAGSLAANAWCAIQGVEILRVHDVAETVDMVRVLSAIQEA
ncbi:MAG: dihydropteroate synthase [Spirochaetales bacterium]|nr:dihydropteroate synthase [Spirochaetales bacterium]